METININGKEYTKKALLDGIYRNDHDVSGLFENLCTFLHHEPTPPKLRPMSELPEGDTQVLFIVKNNKENTWRYGVGVPYCLLGITVNSETYFKSKDYHTKWSNTQLVGWLAALPNPNDIKL